MYFKLVLLSCISMMFAIIAPNFDDIRINSDTIGPFEKNEETSVKVNIVFNVSSAFNARFRVLVKIEEDFYYTCYSSATFYTAIGSLYTFSYNFPTQYLSEEKPLLISYRIYNEDSSLNNIRKQLDFSIQLIKSKTVNIDKLEDKKYIGEPYSLKIINNKIIYNRDEFDFSYLGDDISEEKYLYIDFNKVKFKYLNEIPFSYSSVTATFIDYYNSFPYLNKFNQFTLLNLDLGFNKDNQLYFIKLADGYYVDPLTLMMSANKQDGFVETNTFFLPKNKQDILDGMAINFNFNDFGYAKNRYYFSLKYYYGNTILGDCATSDFCIVGEHK